MFHEMMQITDHYQQQENTLLRHRPVHHAATDGYNASLFFSKLQDEVNLTNLKYSHVLPIRFYRSSRSHYRGLSA